MATVTAGKTFISGETVTPAKLNSLGLPTVSIDDNEVTTSKIPNAAITADKIATGAITGAAGGGKLAASAITGQTTIADALADGDEFLVHDASASALRKVAYSSIAPTVTASKLDGVAQDGSGNNITAGTPPVFGCRAWVNFNGTSTSVVSGETRCTIRASGNVSKVVKNGTGDFTIHFTTAMPDANYCVQSNVNEIATGNVSSGTAIRASDASSLTTTSVRIATGSNYSGGYADQTVVAVAIFR